MEWRWNPLPLENFFHCANTFGNRELKSTFSTNLCVIVFISFYLDIIYHVTMATLLLSSGLEKFIRIDNKTHYFHQVRFFISKIEFKYEISI